MRGLQMRPKDFDLPALWTPAVEPGLNGDAHPMFRERSLFDRY